MVFYGVFVRCFCVVGWGGSGLCLGVKGFKVVVCIVVMYGGYVWL